jgi:hypothetical protein
MPYNTFNFTNTAYDQTVRVDDLIDASNNPIFNGPMNKGDTSPTLQCWRDSNGKGSVHVQGSVQEGLNQTIEDDNFAFNY